MRQNVQGKYYLRRKNVNKPLITVQVQYQQTHPVHPPERVLGLQGVLGHKEAKAGNAGALKVCTVDLVFLIKKF